MNTVIICYLLIGAFLAGMFYTENIMLEALWTRKWWNEVLATSILCSLWLLVCVIILLVRLKDFIANDLNCEAYWWLLTRKKLNPRQIEFTEQFLIRLTLAKDKTLKQRHAIFVTGLLLKYNSPKP